MPDDAEKAAKKDQLRSKVQQLVSYYENEKRRNEELQMELEQLRAQQSNLQGQGMPLPQGYAPQQPAPPQGMGQGANNPMPPFGQGQGGGSNGYTLQSISQPLPPLQGYGNNGLPPMAAPPAPSYGNNGYGALGSPLPSPSYAPGSYAPPAQPSPLSQAYAPAASGYNADPMGFMMGDTGDVFGAPKMGYPAAPPAYSPSSYSPPPTGGYGGTTPASAPVRSLMQQVSQTIDMLRPRLRVADPGRGGYQPYLDYEAMGLLDKLYDQLGELGRLLGTTLI